MTQKFCFVIMSQVKFNSNPTPPTQRPKETREKIKINKKKRKNNIKKSFLRTFSRIALNKSALIRPFNFFFILPFWELVAASIILLLYKLKQ